MYLPPILKMSVYHLSTTLWSCVRAGTGDAIYVASRFVLSAPPVLSLPLSYTVAAATSVKKLM